MSPNLRCGTFSVTAPPSRSQSRTVVCLLPIDRGTFFPIFPCPSHSECPHVSHVVFAAFPQLLKILLQKKESSRPGFLPFSSSVCSSPPGSILSSVFLLAGCEVEGGKLEVAVNFPSVFGLVARVLALPLAHS